MCSNEAPPQPLQRAVLINIAATALLLPTPPNHHRQLMYGRLRPPYIVARLPTLSTRLLPVHHVHAPHTIQVNVVHGDAYPSVVLTYLFGILVPAWTFLIAPIRFVKLINNEYDATSLAGPVPRCVEAA